MTLIETIEKYTFVDAHSDDFFAIEFLKEIEFDQNFNLFLEDYEKQEVNNIWHVIEVELPRYHSFLLYIDQNSTQNLEVSIDDIEYRTYDGNQNIIKISNSNEGKLLIKISRDNTWFYNVKIKIYKLSPKTPGAPYRHCFHNIPGRYYETSLLGRASTLTKGFYKGCDVLVCGECLETKHLRLPMLERHKIYKTNEYFKRVFKRQFKITAYIDLPDEFYDLERITERLKDAVKALKEENKPKLPPPKPSLQCIKHGKVEGDKLVKAGKSKDGIQYYKCKECQKMLIAAHYQSNKARYAENRQINRAKRKLLNQPKESKNDY